MCCLATDSKSGFTLRESLSHLSVYFKTCLSNCLCFFCIFSKWLRTPTYLPGYLLFTGQPVYDVFIRDNPPLSAERGKCLLYGKLNFIFNIYLNCLLFAEHFHYIKRLVGAEYVGIGGDFDGVNRYLIIIIISVGWRPLLDTTYRLSTITSVHRVRGCHIPASTSFLL